MGLYIQSLENIPSEAKRDYFIYLLDYGWSEPLGEALMKNYEKMASLAAENNSVVIRGTQRVHFEDEVFSWHNVNGQNADSLLPAILLTNRNPHEFKESFSSNNHERINPDLKLILIPLKKFCKTTADVIALIQNIFSDIKSRKELKNFKIGREIHKGAGNALADSLILAPQTNDKGIKIEQIETFLQKNNAPILEKTVYRVHFEDRSGIEFERLTFAFLIKQKSWDTISWLGQTGGDGGRDIWGISNGQTYCYQCANFQKLTFKKVKDDIDKLVKNNSVPNYFYLVCGGTATPAIRSKIEQYAHGMGFKNIEIWSGVEFEERIRSRAPELLQRFVMGEAFPELPSELHRFGKISAYKNDHDILAFIAECLDRPAFTTRFQNESNIPDFEQAINDTIEVLNTGVHRLRDGTIIRNIPSRHRIKDQHLKSELAEIVSLVVSLRDTFIQLKRNKDIRACGCNIEDCPTWFFSNNACTQMDKIRKRILDKFNSIYPDFRLKLI